jgi:hypothetical protein
VYLKVGPNSVGFYLTTEVQFSLRTIVFKKQDDWIMSKNSLNLITYHLQKLLDLNYLFVKKRLVIYIVTILVSIDGVWIGNRIY